MDWHRLFGLLLTDYFTDSPYVVEVEYDLSWQQQFLDVVIVRKGKGRFKEILPDGLDDFGPHNLISFKSHHEALDAWAMKELIGHSVSYRKLVSPSTNALLPESDFQLYAVSARYPHNLAQQVPWREEKPGVYRCRWGTDEVRVVVPRQLPETENNVPLHLFAAEPDRVQYGQSHYRKRSEATSSLLKHLLQKYEGEGMPVAYTMQDFIRDYTIEQFEKLTPELRRVALQRLSPEELRESLSPEQIEYLRQSGEAAPPPTKPSKAAGSGRKRRKP